MNNIIDILANRNMYYDISYHASDVYIILEGLNDDRLTKIHYLGSKIVKIGDNRYRTKFISVNHKNITSKIQSVLTLYNSKCVMSSEYISFDNIIDFKIDNIVQFSGLFNVKISEIVDRMDRMKIKYRCETHVKHLEMRLVDNNIMIQLYKESMNIPKTIFIHITSYSIDEYRAQLRTAANIMGLIPHTLDQIMVPGKVIMIL